MQFEKNYVIGWIEQSEIVFGRYLRISAVRAKQFDYNLGQVEEICEYLKDVINAEHQLDEVNHVESDELNMKVQELEMENNHLVKEIEKLRNMIETSNMETIQPEGKEDYIPDISSEIFKDQSHFLDIINRMNEDINDLRSSYNYYKNKCESFDSIDWNNSMTKIVEAYTDMYNDVQNTDNWELKQSFQKIIEYLDKELSSNGMHLKFHKVGEKAPDGFVDTIFDNTDDPAKDNTIKTVRRFGCTFDNGAIPAISEQLTVYRYT